MIEGRSERIFVDLCCPRCNTRNKYEVFEEIQSDIDVRAKQLLLDGRLFDYNCKECGFETDAPYEMFYYDTIHNAMIHFVEPSEVENACATMSETIKDAKMGWSELLINCQKRVVYHPRILQEKAMIFDVGMDDRAVEIMKVLCVDSTYDVEVSSNGKILFDVQDGEHCFKLFVDGSVVNTIVFPQDVYEHIKGRLENVLNMLEDYIIDEQWAREFMAKCELVGNPYVKYLTE